MLLTILEQIEARLVRMNTRELARLATRAGAAFSAEESAELLDLETKPEQTEQEAKRHSALAKRREAIAKAKEQYSEALARREQIVARRKKVMTYIRSLFGVAKPTDSEADVEAGGEIVTDWMDRKIAAWQRFLGRSAATFRRVTDWVTRPKAAGWRIVRGIIAAPAYVVLTVLHAVRFAALTVVGTVALVVAAAGMLVALALATVTFLAMLVTNLIGRIPWIGRPIRLVLDFALLGINAVFGFAFAAVMSALGLVNVAIVGAHNVVLMVVSAPFKALSWTAGKARGAALHARVTPTIGHAAA